MRSSTVSRRVLGLAAAGVLSLSTLALPGIALADDGETSSSSQAEVTSGTADPDATVSDTPAPSADQTPEVQAAAPAVPYLNSYPEGTDGGLRVNFVDESVAPDKATSFESTIDNGTTWVALADVQVIDGRTFGTVTGLTNGTSYTIKVRASNTSGHSAGSNPITANAYKPVGAPTNVVATRTATSVTVSWNEPAVAGTYAVDFFSVGYSGGEYGDEGCRVAATVHTCTFALPSGDDYQLSVFASDTDHHSGQTVRLQTGAVAAPAAPTAVPTKDDGDIQGPAGPISTLTAGTQVVLKGDGYLAGSSVRLTMFSSPVDLGTAVVASDGTFTATVTVPANLANGTHHLVASGVDASGNVRNLVITVTVSGGQATLAVTGFDAVPVAVGGGLVVLAGAGLVLGGRRRRA